MHMSKFFFYVLLCDVVLVPELSTGPDHTYSAIPLKYPVGSEPGPSGGWGCVCWRPYPLLRTNSNSEFQYLAPPTTLPSCALSPKV